MDCACSAAINYDINNTNTFLADPTFWSVFSGVGHWPTFFINQCGVYVVPKTLWVTVRTGDQAAFIENLIEPSIAAMASASLQSRGSKELDQASSARFGPPSDTIMVAR